MAAVNPLFSLKKALSHFRSKQPKFALYIFSLRGGLDQDFLLCSLFDPAPFVSAWEKSIINFIQTASLCCANFQVRAAYLRAEERKERLLGTGAARGTTRTPRRWRRPPASTSGTSTTTGVLRFNQNNSYPERFYI